MVPFSMTFMLYFKLLTTDTARGLSATAELLV